MERLADFERLGINHQSPLIHFSPRRLAARAAGNQSPIPFDTLGNVDGASTRRWESITNPL